jgi:hypothetical protein
MCGDGEVPQEPTSNNDGHTGQSGMTVLTTRGRVRVRAHPREKSLENFLPMELNRSVQKNGTAI